jgi:hypothetical protein
MATPRKGPEAHPKVRSPKSAKKGSKETMMKKTAGRFPHNRK